MGCPDKPYFSDEIYRYPVCLKLEFGCFTSDIECCHKKLRDLYTLTTVSPLKSTQTNCEQQKPLDTTPVKWNKQEIIFIVLSVLVLLSITFTSVYLNMRIKNEIRALRFRKKEQEEEPLFKSKPEADTRGDLTEHHNSQKSGYLASVNVLGKLESELIVDNTNLSQLLIRYCRSGAFKNLEGLMNEKILKQKEDVNIQRMLTSRCKDGYTLLHYAAEGGSLSIFKALINATDQIKVDDTTYDGRTVLHIACKGNHLPLCTYLIKNYETLLLNKASNPGWNAAHYTAAGGNFQILNLLERNGLDITCTTNNCLNILDIACLYNNKMLCKHIMKRNDLKLPLDKSNEHGWTIAHFAAMVGNEDVFNWLVEKNIDMVKTKLQKTILHICCEYGNYDICKIILKCYEGIVYHSDHYNWNALHYAAKGGNLKVYKKVERYFRKYARLDEITREKETVLHIACINKSTKICQYICNNNLYQGIIKVKCKLNDWTAAHYVAVEIEEGEADEELIRILVQSGIDLQAVSTDGLTVLGVACQYQNRKLINYLLREHNQLLGVGILCLKNAAKDANDENIEYQINEALENYKLKKENHDVRVIKPHSLTS